MQKEKIYEFAIERPLTPVRRKAVEKHIERRAKLFAKAVSYRWDEGDDDVLHIEAKPVVIEVRFNGKSVELYGTAPLWARLLFTQQKKNELKEQIQSALQEAKFVTATKAKKPAIRAKKLAAKTSTKTPAKTPAKGRNVAGKAQRIRATV